MTQPSLLDGAVAFDARLIQGPDLTPRDRSRLCRQGAIVRDLMLDGAWRTLAEIEAATEFPQASISARLRDCRKAGYVVARQRRTEGQFEYRVTREQ